MHLNRAFQLTSAIALLLIASPALAQNEGEDAPVAEAQAAKREGKVVDGPRNIREFDPEDKSHVVDATDINLKKVFEDLGADATLWYQHVQTLANPFFEGRAPGTRGGELAAEYIEFYFREYGLKPAFPPSGEAADKPGGGIGDAAMTSYVQPFDFASPDPKVELVDAVAAIDNKPLKQGDDYAVLGVSGNGTVSAPVTFIGYGIEDHDGYTSFDDDTDLTGRIALVLRYEPLNEDGKSRWTEVRFSRFSSIGPKLEAIAKRHAAGVILVNPPGAVDGKTGLESLTTSARFGERLKVPVVQMTPKAADALLLKADPKKRDLMTWRKLADDGEVTSVELSDSLKVNLTTDLNVDDRLHTQNIAAVLPGRGALADQWIVIGAHYDHVGFGYTGAMPNNVGKLHPGADDNASGTAGLLIAAKRLANDYETSPGATDRRSILFMAFGAEEAGLLGSEHFIEHSSIPSKNIYCMLNMDMIGRLRQHNVLVQGWGTAKEFAEILPPIVEASGLTVSKVASGRGPSDHASFFGAGIPVLFMFTGEHDVYHTPQDRAYTVNPAGAIEIVELLQSIALEFSTRTGPLTFVTPASGAGGGNAAARPGQSRVRLGIMPGYNANLETGILVDDVTAGTSAGEAGIQQGDVLLTWNGEELTGGAKLAEVLGKANPGDKVKVTVQRGDKNLTIEITLKARE